MADDVEASTASEISKVMRAAAQMGLLLAERRRQQLWRAEQESRQQARQLQSVVDDQKRLAAPVWAKANDPTFWHTATPQDAAFVYGVAKRFEAVDPAARQAAAHCEERAARQWGLTREALQPGNGPVDLPQTTQALIAPTLRGEEAVDWAVLEAQVGATAATTPTPSTEQVAAPDAIDVVGAREWFSKHYARKDTSLVSSDTQVEFDKYVVRLQAALAAEGFDLDNPPRLNKLENVRDEWEAQAAGAWQDVADLHGVSLQTVENRVDRRAHRAILAAKEAELAGEYPDLISWGWNVMAKGSDAHHSEDIDVRLVGDHPRPGVYLPAMRQAAREEAAEAGMDVDTYLDHLQPIQRRGLLCQQDSPVGYEQGLAHARAYRVAYAAASARQRPEWSTRGTEPVQAEKRSQEKQDTAALDASLAEGVVAAAAGAVVAEEATQVAWDSQEARAAWAQGLLEKGFEPDAVRAAFTADQVLTKPVGSITAAPGGIQEQNHPAAHFAEMAMRANLGTP